jgi:hypothetical protein|tara:strand:+ start:1918 stop:2349 length:432 start_codon:yes stop_codon:yes gene_type:complete
METLQHRNASFISHQPIIKDHRNYVWQSLRKNPNGLTAQQITDLSNKRVSLISSRSRLNELLNDCLIRVKGSARNPKTGKVNSTYCTLEKSESLNLIENKLISLVAEHDLLIENYFKYKLIDERLNSIDKEIERLEHKKLNLL